MITQKDIFGKARLASFDFIHKLIHKRRKK